MLIGCGGTRQLAVLKNRSVDEAARPVKLYISERDFTGQQVKYELPSFTDTLEHRLEGEKVWLRNYISRNPGGYDHYIDDTYQNPFVLADSIEADLVAIIRISMLDYMKLKDIQSTDETFGDFVTIGDVSLLGGNRRVGVFAADCEITDVRTNSVVHDFSSAGLSAKGGLNKRQALKHATEDSIEPFIKELFRE